VKRGLRTIKDGAIELLEKLGRNDPCPCGSGRRGTSDAASPAAGFDGAERRDYWR
jgi:hypothetical protein